MAKLIIKDLHVKVLDKEILKGINLEVATNEFHAIMGPNGNGKSTLLQAIMGHPKYIITKGSIHIDDLDITNLEVDKRAIAGLFLGMQYPVEVSGVTNADFLRAAINAKEETKLSLFKFIKTMDKEIESLKMSPSLAQRYLNEGFSGGEKKRNEILQMKLLKPRFALLDEIDSGLDVDAMRIVSEAINEMKSNDFGALIVSHYERFFELVVPNYVHVLVDGKIVKTGGYEIIQKIDASGYDWIKDELGIDFKEETSDFTTLEL
ncbi:MAG: Fe-S cluster assembly ATPase SufC [Bacilli bacterium]